MTNKLGGSGHTENGESSLKNVALERDIAGEQNAGDNSGEGDGSGSRVLPAEEGVEEGVVVGEVLSGSSLAVRCLAGGGQVGELVLGGGSLIASLVGNGAVGDRLHGLRVLDGVHGVGGSCC